MTLLQRIFNSPRNERMYLVEDARCRHDSLAPMWENVRDMGESDKITRYRCLTCGEFMPAAAAPAHAHRVAA